MKKIIKAILPLVFLASPVAMGSEAKYKDAFISKVHKFGQLNRFDIRNINRDKYVNCIMQVKIKITLDKAGKVVTTEVTDPAPVPMVNNYFTYIVNNARPPEPLEKYISSPPEQVIIEEYFRLKLTQYENQKISKPCK